ncbi:MULTISPECIES: hypothetical protein [Rheinheimera]|uniref:Uncharacterized protein n=1 Tax=Rheinheimera marina TaxID=1774958 RepID=A0ABV9JL33_9GAMM
MKPFQIVGLFFSLLAFSYYLLISSDPQDSSPSAGFGAILIILLSMVSAVLLIPSSFGLWRKNAREARQVTGPFWLSLLAVNSLLALFYSGVGLVCIYHLSIWYLQTH